MLRRKLPAGLVTGFAAASLVLASAGVASADEGDGAVCETQEVVVKGRSVPVMLEPSVDAPRLYTASKGEFHKCSAVKVGGEHNECGASKSNVWVILTDYKRFDTYIPSHCVADVFR
ncbi:hypothetical protein [Stackebrandtia nassauensis]|uniref:Secreted protein n=1 Tax=Stackebrandtia nassauensis (strain DSM 44728 / CIP 108903 / NRRL B-16338 / NBRC 102104 / LLR-40K-21) TaxID=446470 RepID=D3Q0K1_STANL|nr:hypothetical protein [Stackebrandtia nassauensis]ADD41737.1 hypothetical protein Snas_2042 [Stackebrandtia nassauensis DSM 44728]